MRFSERYKILALTESADVTTSGVDSQSINMGKVHTACFLLNFGSVTADDALKVYVGAATATKTTAIAFKYRLAAADTKSALSDTFGAFTDVASTGLTLTAAWGPRARAARPGPGVQKIQSVCQDGTAVP